MTTTREEVRIWEKCWADVTVTVFDILAVMSRKRIVVVVLVKVLFVDDDEKSVEGAVAGWRGEN